MPESPGNQLLDTLSTYDFALLRPHLAMVRLQQKTVLQEAHTAISHAYFPIDAMISLVAAVNNGDVIEIAAIGREGAIGLKLGTQRRHLSFARVIVQLPGAALKIAVERFQEAALKSLAIAHIAACANEIVAANVQQAAACNALHSVESRLAKWLLQAHDRFGNDELPLSHEFLAQMLGTRRTTVSLTAHALQAAGMIKYRRAKVQITDCTALETISCDCHRTLQRNIGLILKSIS
jgi:CRP-like cAMP-binding protein